MPPSSPLPPTPQAAEFFSSECDGPQACPADKQKHYILQTLHLPRALRRDLSRAAFEGSTHYAQAGPRLAQGLHEVGALLSLLSLLGCLAVTAISTHNLRPSRLPSPTQPAAPLPPPVAGLPLDQGGFVDA